MKLRTAMLIVWAALAITVCGCCHDPFACCDRRKSLADWFDIYGPTGCSSCRDCDCPRR